MSYHADRFYAAVAVLAGHGHIKQRLIKAYEDNLVAISEDELPIAVKQTFSDLKHQLNRVTPLNGEGAVCASVRKMSVDEAAEPAASTTAKPSATVGPTDDEESDSFEAGIKSELLDGRLRVNATAFHTNYKNLQFIERHDPRPRDGARPERANLSD